MHMHIMYNMGPITEHNTVIMYITESMHLTTKECHEDKQERTN